MIPELIIRAELDFSSLNTTGDSSRDDCIEKKFKTEMKFRAVLGRRGCREKKPPNCHKNATFWGVFFNFLG